MRLSNIFIGNNHYNYDWIHLLDQYKKVVTKNDTVLEIGSSNPNKTHELARCCHKLVGLEKDPSPKLGNNIIIGDWTKLKAIFPKHKFDIIIASHVIEHVEDDLSCLNQTYHALKAGGYFIFTTPNRERLFERLRSIVYGKRKFPYHEHVREYTQKDINALLSKSEFNTSKIAIQGIVFGLHASPVHLFLKDAPNIVANWVNFWEVTIQKNQTNYANK